VSKPLFRRILAYIIDGIIVSIVSSAIAFLPLFKKYSTKYDEYSEEYTEMIREVAQNPEKANEIFSDEKIKDMAYDLSKSGIYLSVITLVVTVSYFVGFQYYTGGKTGGKAIMKIEVVSTKDEPLSLSQLFTRSLIINNLFVDTISLIIIAFCTKSIYIGLSSYIELLELGLLLVTFGMVIYNDEGISLHDKIAGTRVILSSEKSLLEKKNVKEAKVVKEKKKK
jgi:uncharacterized RDD family membrane protein YckC